jgi:hypothetical protein
VSCIQWNVKFVYVSFSPDGKMNDWLLEQRIMKCCVKLSKSASEILWKVTEDYGAESVIKVG